MKKIILLFLFTIGITSVMAQLEIDPATIDQGVANPNLQELSIDRFEEPGFWRVHIPIDDGVITHRALFGSPLAKNPVENLVSNVATVDERVLGVRADFFRRSISTLSILPLRPVPIPGIAHTLSIWVAGRNTKHHLKIVLRDTRGRIRILNFGKLNFLGWKQLTVAVPPGLQDERDFRGDDIDFKLEIIGFYIESDLLETYGRFYIYFDDLRAVSDMTPFIRDPDDMVDNW